MRKDEKEGENTKMEKMVSLFNQKKGKTWRQAAGARIGYEIPNLFTERHNDNEERKGRTGRGRRREGDRGRESQRRVGEEKERDRESPSTRREGSD